MWVRHDSGEQTTIKNSQALGPASPLETDEDGYAEVADDDAAELLAALDRHVELASAPPSEGEDSDAGGEAAVADPPFDPGEMTVSEIRDAIGDIDDPAVLDAIYDAEVAGEARSTALEAIDRRREAVEA